MTEWLAPETVGEAADVLRSRAGREGPLLVTGAADPPDAAPDGAPRPEAVVSTARLSGVLRHRPRDLTVTASAGTRMDDLLGRLAERGGWIPVAGPALELSVGGVVASALPGPYDAGLGDLRRQLLACGVITWEGERARWGRGVMKNVAGYGMTRAVAGSRGRLGVIHSATFRLWPAPEVRRTASLRPDGDALAAADRIARSDFDAEVRPDAVVWRRGPDGDRLTLELAGTPGSVDLRMERLRSRAADAGLEVAEVADARSPAREVERRAAGPFGRGREAGRSAAWVTTGRGGFAPAARAAGDALGASLATLEGYPLSGDLRCAWRPPEGGGSSDAFHHLLDALAGTPVRLERGSRRETAAADDRRDPGVRRLEERVVEALGGRPRHWMSGYL